MTADCSRVIGVCGCVDWGGVVGVDGRVGVGVGRGVGAGGLLCWKAIFNSVGGYSLRRALQLLFLYIYR